MAATSSLRASPHALSFETFRDSALRASRAGLWVVAILAAGVLVALPEQSQDALLGVAASAAAVAALVQPLVAVVLLLVAVPFGGIARGASAASGDTSTDLSFGAAELLVALLTVVWLARAVRRRRLDIRAGGVAVATLAMASLAALSIGYADDRPAAIKESLKWFELLLAMLVVVDLAGTTRATRWVVGAMLVAGAAEATYGAVQFVTNSGPGAFELQGALRAFGHFDQPNPFAGYLTTILPLAVCMAVCRANPIRFRWLAVASASLLAVGIGLSQSRGAWLGALVAAACLLLAWSVSTRRLLIPCVLGGVLALALAISGLLPAAILDRLAQTIQYFGVFDVRGVEVTSDNWAIVERMAHWQAGWYMFLDHSWLGVGAGNYAQAYPDYFVGMWREPLGHAHNYYLNMLAELGVVGGGILAVLLGLAFSELGGALVRSEAIEHSFWRAVLAGAFGGLVVFCVHNLFDSLFVHSVNVQVGVLLGLGLLAADRLRTEQPGPVSA
ncbi:MAG TPA: O-antigen ligase family protein [Chloroflexota bacterium]